ncbi:MAG: WhiB family transcriptional regulator [Acidimicrobiia bacterium]
MPTGREWQQWARCRGPEARLFFPPTAPERPDERVTRETQAKAICASCEVQGECLEEALRIREPYGIWGGLTESERHVLLSRRAVV